MFYFTDHVLFEVVSLIYLCYTGNNISNFFYNTFQYIQYFSALMHNKNIVRMITFASVTYDDLFCVCSNVMS